jgi:S-adenosylmethionine hydrolase
MERTRVVAIVSDFGPDSFYVGVMKGAIVHAAPGCDVVDITHSVQPHAVAQGSFILDTVYEFFPPGTVFLAVVDPGVGGARANVVVEAGGRFLVGPDNGLATEVVARSSEVRVFIVDEGRIERFRSRPPTGKTFLGRDVFAPAAGALAAGHSPRDIGARAEGGLTAVDVPAVERSIADGRIAGRGRYVDSFGNILTGITVGDIQRVFKRYAPADIHAVVEGQDLGTLCDHYAQRPDRSLMAVVNSWNRVEVSVNEGRAIDRFAGKRPEELCVELKSPATANS